MRHTSSDRKAQITFSVIVGMILILAMASVLILRDYLAGSKAAIGAEQALPGFAAPIQDYVEECLVTTANDAILYNGRAGGYLALPPMSTRSLYEDVPYYYDAGDLSPSDEILAAEMGRYVDGMLDLCLHDFDVFTKQGYDISAGKPSSEAVLGPSALSLHVTFPLRIALGSQITEISSFTVDAPVEQFYDDLLVARKLVASSSAKGLCVTCISDAALRNNLTVQTLSYFNHTYVIDIADDDYVIADKDYHLRFAVRYNETV